jgi:cyclophilin family peptidyl-prolyl cis-trans isomerase
MTRVVCWQRRGLLRLCSGIVVAIASLGLLVHAQGAKPPAAAPPPLAPVPGPVIVFETVKGTFEIETYPTIAPKSVAHIITLVNEQFYDGLRIHRRDENFVVQFGDPQTRDLAEKANWGRAQSGDPIGVAEVTKVLKQAPGMVSIAHRGDAAKGDSQLFIVIGPASHIDGKFAIVGRVTTGLDVVRKLEVEDRILKATVKAAGE